MAWWWAELLAWTVTGLLLWAIASCTYLGGGNPEPIDTGYSQHEAARGHY